jgi:cytochrome c oxidase subunit 1
MSTAQLAATEIAAAPTPPERTYLNASYGLKSWLLTGDHKRIAMMYLVGVSFFVVGGVLA